MTGHAALRAKTLVVFLRHGRSDLLAHGRACSDLVATITVQTRARAMFGVAEIYSISLRRFGSARKSSNVVAGVAGRDVVFTRTCAGRVALKAR
jgi:hypothetical protein